MTDRNPHLTLVSPEAHEERGNEAPLPHEQLDVYDVLEQAYPQAMSWQGVSWAKGTGDQLKRSASTPGAVPPPDRENGMIPGFCGIRGRERRTKGAV